MELKGTIERVFYSKELFSAVSVRYRNEYGVFQNISAAGKIVEAQVGMEIIAEGEFTTHPKFGMQFNVTSSILKIPKTTSAVVRYLSSGCFTGINEKLAQRIVDAFGVNVVEEIIEKEPEKLTKVRGIGKHRAKQIAKDHAQNFVYRDLASMNLSESQIAKLFEQYKDKAAEVLRTNPYSVIYEISGFSFRTVDSIARKNGIDINDPKRIAAAITFVLTDIGSQGHCWCHIDNLDGLIRETVPGVPDELIAEQISVEIENKRIILEDYQVYAASMYHSEVATAKGLVSMLTGHNTGMNVSEDQIQSAIRDVEWTCGFTLDRSQRNAIELALRNRVSVITGGPGTGKSTIISAIIKGFMKQYTSEEKTEDHVLLCAPTGKASRRMAEITGIRAESIQRVLTRVKRYEEKMKEAEDPDEYYEESEDEIEPIVNKLIILDEASMVDIYLANDLIRLAQDDNWLVMIGDVDQLPPIGPGNFFRDCIDSPFIPTARLELSHRQKGAIALNAKRINDGLGMHALKLDDPSFTFVPAEKMEVQEKVIQEYMDLIEAYDVQDVACIVPMRKAGRSQTSADDLNRIIRDKLNPSAYGKIEIPELNLREGDRVMNTINDYEKNFFNGDCGFIVAINQEDNIVYIEADDGRIIEFNFNNIRGRLVLGYALTVHKAQGSEYKAIVVAQSREHYVMLQRNLLYTAVTRAKDVVTLVGEQDAVNLAVSKIPSLERNTKLKDRIKTFMIDAT